MGKKLDDGVYPRDGSEEAKKDPEDKNNLIGQLLVQLTTEYPFGVRICTGFPGVVEVTVTKDDQTMMKFYGKTTVEALQAAMRTK